MQKDRPPSYITGWQACGTSKSIFGGVLFADLSICWYSVSFSASNPSADPNDPALVQRSARFLQRPEAHSREALLDAHETYGESVAAFSESFEGTGQHCARGEGWDLASEALKYFDQFDYVPKPVPSTARTHGHLIFSGQVSANGSVQAGRWRGGDDTVRRGDIVEFKDVRIKSPEGCYVILGAHTAIIVSNSEPSIPVSDGKSVKPTDLRSLEVVEQTPGNAPARRLYDLTRIQEGELWIYRPIGMKAYVGAYLSCKCPDDAQVVSV